jgi:hypothetical protein
MEKATIEHIAPEKAKFGTKADPEIVANIGNLILVNEQLNKLLSNKPFAEKQQTLKSAGVWVDAILLKARQWGEKEIASRAEFMAKQSYEEVWKLGKAT